MALPFRSCHFDRTNGGSNKLSKYKAKGANEGNAIAFAIAIEQYIICTLKSVDIVESVGRLLGLWKKTLQGKE